MVFLKKIALILLVLVNQIAAMPTANSQPSGAPDLPSMVKTSDLIVVGVGDFDRFRSPTLKDGKLTFKLPLRASRVLKGNLPGNSPILTIESTVDGLQSASVYPRFTDVQPAIFFLKATKSGSYWAADPFYFSLPASGTTGTLTLASGDALTNVALELTRELAMPPDVLKQGLADVSYRNMPDNLLTDRVEGIYDDITEALVRVPRTIIDNSLAAISVSDKSTTTQRLWANKVLVKLGDWRYIDSVKAALLDPPTNASRAVGGLTIALYCVKDSDYARIPLMSALLGSKNVGVRRRATECLGKIGGGPVLEPLARQALNDMDAEVRWQAMAALSECTGLDKYYPDGVTKHSASAKYIEFWRSWSQHFFGVPAR